MSRMKNEGFVYAELTGTPEHQAQLINYLKAANVEVGLLVNFGNQKLEYKRLQHPDHFVHREERIPFLLPFPTNENF